MTYATPIAARNVAAQMNLNLRPSELRAGRYRPEIIPSTLPPVWRVVWRPASSMNDDCDDTIVPCPNCRGTGWLICTENGRVVGVGVYNGYGQGLHNARCDCGGIGPREGDPSPGKDNGGRKDD